MVYHPHVCGHSPNLVDAAESMALEASARVAVTNAIENKEDLGGMLGKRYCIQPS